MKITVFQITQTESLAVQIQGTTLDEITRVLPQGFYTTFSTLAHGTKVLGLETHLQRLYAPAKEQHITPSVDGPVLRKRIAEMAKLNLPKESRIRLILTKNSGIIYIGVQPFEPLPQSAYNMGVKVITADMVRQSPRIKDTGFISSSLDQRKQMGKDVFEVLLVKNKGILEGMTSNFYAVKESTLITAQSGILLGITRRVILRLARGQGISIQYRSPKTNENFDEAFLTSSSRGVVPIVSINKNVVGQGRVGHWTKMLSEAYHAYVERRSEKIVG